MAKPNLLMSQEPMGVPENSEKPPSFTGKTADLFSP
jgi:hypothetical protein